MIGFLVNGGPLWVAVIGMAAGLVFMIVKFAIIDRKTITGIASVLKTESTIRQDVDARGGREVPVTWPAPDFGNPEVSQSVIAGAPTAVYNAYVEPRTYRVLAKIPGGELDISAHVISIVVPDEIGRMLDQLQATTMYPDSEASTAPESAREAGTTAGAENRDDPARGQA